MRVVPVGGPRVIAGVDVGGEAFFKPVELIGSDEVHLAGQAGAVAELAQIVGERGNEAGNSAALSYAPILVTSWPAMNATVRGRTAASCSTQRRSACRVRRAHQGSGSARSGAVGAGELRRELVRHDHHDVRSLGHGQDATATLNARSMTVSIWPQRPICSRICETHSSIGRLVSTRISGVVGAS